jgi:hypothetical protein
MTTIPPQSPVPVRTTQPFEGPIPVRTQPFEVPIPGYSYQGRSPSNWHRTGTNAMNRSIGYASEPTPDYSQRDYYHPTRSVILEPTFDKRHEPRILHYYTGYDYFSTVDPSDPMLTRHHSTTTTGPGAPIRYSVNPPYRPQGDYIKSTM